jgi:peptide/nickel transport system permease protein|tara:strand:- start:432 stop:1475 length:1044 start_codon:yes stop_codon:yes gene_type:complete
VARLVAARLVRLGAVLLAVSFLTFMMANVLPGDPIDALIPIELQEDQEFVAELREEWGLNDPLLGRYGRWLGNAVQGDLGKSYITGRPIMDEVTPRLPITAELMVVSIGLALLVAVPLGVLSAYREGSSTDQSVTAGALLGISTPNFLLGIILIYFMAVKLHWFPAVGWVRISDSFTGNLKSVALPAVSLAVAEAAVFTRIVRSDMIATLKENYILSARAKGLRDRFILFRHGLRPSSLTLITVVGLNAAGLIGGTIILERLFAIPGVGWRLFNAVLQRDYMMVQGITMLIAAFYVIINAVVDFIYLAVDPRILGGSRSGRLRRFQRRAGLSPVVGFRATVRGVGRR